VVSESVSVISVGLVCGVVAGQTKGAAETHRYARELDRPDAARLALDGGRGKAVSFTGDPAL